MTELEILTNRCAETHTLPDIIKHLREELHEVDTAIDKCDRNRGSIHDVIEECTDVLIDIHTVFTKLHQMGIYDQHDVVSMMAVKLQKFETMLQNEKNLVEQGLLSYPIDRYTGFGRM